MSRSKCRSCEVEPQKAAAIGGPSGDPKSFALAVAEGAARIKAHVTPAAVFSVNEDDSMGVDD